VWIDALFNYLTAVDTPERRHLWPATIHLIGKDILWFHSVIWPCLLMALNPGRAEAEYLPRTVFGHGWWIAEGQKMSKSLGNFIDLAKLKAYAGRYSLDGLRWYLATQGPIGGTDADFSHAKFVEVYNADLANGIGNCASRVSNMIGKYFGGQLPEGGAGASPVPSACSAAVDRARSAVDAFDLGGACRQGIEIVRAVDLYINQTEPFKLAKRLDGDAAVRPQLAAILSACAEALRIASLLLAPAMPQKMADLQRRWNCSPPPGVPLADLARFGGPHAVKPGAAIEKGDALFMRADVVEAPPS
jgi:methionyl-tRNA synthetase